MSDTEAAAVRGESVDELLSVLDDSDVELLVLPGDDVSSEDAVDDVVEPAVVASPVPDDLAGLSGLAALVCRRGDIKTLQALSQCSKAAVLDIRGCGPKVFIELERILAVAGLSFAAVLDERAVSSDWFDWSQVNMSRAMMETQTAWVVADLFMVPQRLTAQSFVDRVRATVGEHYPYFRLSCLHRAMLSGDGQSIVVAFPVGHGFKVDRLLWLMDVLETMAIDDGRA